MWTSIITLIISVLAHSWDFVASINADASGFCMVGMAMFGFTVLTQGFPGKAMYDTSQPGGEHAEDVSPLVKLFSPQETPLLDLLGLDPRPIHNVRHEWLEDELIPDETTLSNALTANAADNTLTVPDASIFQVGELIQAGWETMLVTAVDETNDQLTVTRGYGEDTPIVHASGETIMLAGEVSFEGADAPDPQNSSMGRPFNISHIFNYALSITGTRKAADGFHLGDIGDEFAYETAKRTIEALRDLEAAIVFSDWNLVGGAPSIGTATVRRTMRGIVNFIRYGYRFATGGSEAAPADCFRNVGGIRFTYDNWRDYQQQVVYNNGAREASICLIPPALKTSVGKWKRAAQGIMTTNTDPENKRVSEIVNVVETDFGLVYFVMMPRLSVFSSNNQHASILICPKMVKPKAFIGRPFHTFDLAKTGDSEKRELLGEYGLEMNGVTKGYHSICYNWTQIP